jgi:hypothetical protein
LLELSRESSYASCLVFCLMVAWDHGLQVAKCAVCRGSHLGVRNTESTFGDVLDFISTFRVIQRDTSKDSVAVKSVSVLLTLNPCQIIPRFCSVFLIEISLVSFELVLYTCE